MFKFFYISIEFKKTIKINNINPNYKKYLSIYTKINILSTNIINLVFIYIKIV